MKKCLNIHYIMLYCETYIKESKHIYFFDLNNYKVVSRDELINKFGYTDSLLNDEISLECNYSILPLFQVNVIEKISKFLVQENQRNLLKSLNDLSDNDIYILFQKICDSNPMISGHWDEFIKKCEADEAIKWCKEHNIAYIL